VLADAVDDDGADVVGQVRETVADRQDDAVIERVALGRAVEADGHHPAGDLDLQQFRLSAGAAASAFPIAILCPGQIVMFYNLLGRESTTPVIPAKNSRPSLRKQGPICGRPPGCKSLFV